MTEPPPTHHRAVALVLAFVASLTVARFGVAPPTVTRASDAPVVVDAGPLRVDPNRDDARRLEALPGVGPRMAARILAARSARPFTGPDDLLRVRGIGPRTLARMRPYLVFPGPTGREENVRPR